MPRSSDAVSRACHVLSLGACLAFVSPDAVHAQSCPASSVTVNRNTRILTTDSGSDTQTGPNGVIVYNYSGLGASASMSLEPTSRGNLTIKASYRFLGLLTGTPVTQSITGQLTGTVAVLSGESQCAANSVTGSLALDNSLVILGQWFAEQGPSSCLGSGGSSQTTFSVARPAGTPFELSTVLSGTTGQVSRVGAQLTLQYGPLPPGVFLVRCDGVTVTGVLGVTPEASTGLKIGALWPNPNHGVFQANVFVPQGSTAILRLLDVSGRMVRSRTVEATGTMRAIAFDDRLLPGTYFLQLSQGATTAVRQVVIGD